MKNNLIGFTATALLMLAAACSPQTNTLVTDTDIPVPQKPAETRLNLTPQSWITLDGGQNQLEFNPQVDILFVIDNSDSMRAAEANLVRNMDRFADGIVKNKMIDYHIGVVSTWDSTERYLNSPARQDGYQIGDLRFVKDSKDQKLAQRFLTRAEDKSLLASTLKIGVLSYAEGGPEVEEFFSPLSAALDKSGRGATNEGFFRDEAQLVVVFMTDADDSTSQLTPAQMTDKLIAFKGGRAEKVTVYGALVKASDPDQYKDWDLRVHPKYHPECFNMTKKTPVNTGKCHGFGPARMEQLIQLANSGSGTAKQIQDEYIMSIISKDFGADLSKIGSGIKEKTLAKEISLAPNRPMSDPKTGLWMIQVRYGTPEDLAAGKGIVIKPGKKAGWLYNADHNSIQLAGDIKAYEQAPEGSRFAIDIFPMPEAQ